MDVCLQNNLLYTTRFRCVYQHKTTPRQCDYVGDIALYGVSVGYYMYWWQHVIWCPNVSEDNNKSRVDLKNM